MNISELQKICHNPDNWPQSEERVLMQVIEQITLAWRAAENGNDIGWFWIHHLEEKGCIAVTAEASNIARASIILLDYLGFAGGQFNYVEDCFKWNSQTTKTGFYLSAIQKYIELRDPESAVGMILAYAHHKFWPIEDIIKAIIKSEKGE